MAMYQAGKSAAIFLKHRAKDLIGKAKGVTTKGMSKAKDVTKKTKKTAKKIYKKNPVFDKSDVAFIKQNPGLSAGAAGVGLVAGEGLYGIGSGTYNLATGKRNVRVKKQTAKEIKKMQKMYNV